MEIPESINSLTTEVPTTSITQIDIQKNIDTTGILESLKHNTSLSDFRNIEIGLAFYKKDAVSDRNFINNILLLVELNFEGLSLCRNRNFITVIDFIATNIIITIPILVADGNLHGI